MIRFWDTSALVKLYARSEPGHRRAVGLLHGARAGLHHMTSMLVAVELASVLTRTTRNRSLVDGALRQLDAMSQVEVGEVHRDVGVRLAREGRTRGADTVIAAQALVVAEAAREPLEFVTADAAQGRLVASESRRRRLRVRLIALPA